MIARMLLPSLVFASMCAALYAVFIYVPTEKEMGVVQRIFYFHVPAAISAFIAFFLVFVGSIQYLRTRTELWDRLARCAAELGVLFSVIVLVTGPLWARPIWGVYWHSDPLPHIPVLPDGAILRSADAADPAFRRRARHSRFCQRAAGLLFGPSLVPGAAAAS